MMTQKASFRLFTMIIIFSFACNFATGLTNGGNGPKNFTAALTAPDVVLLTWDAVEGATGYILELSIDKGDSVSIVALPPERTNYEDLTAPELGNLTYQVQVIMESGPAGTSQVSIESGERQPNPLTVIPEYDEKNATTTMIGTEGGTASLIDANKVEYTLVIPQGALSADTEIRMTAVSAIQDWPLDGNQLGAVRLEPEGLVLNDAAILAIGIPFDVNPALAIVGYEFDVNGQEFHLQPSDDENGLTNKLPAMGAHLASLALQKPNHNVSMPVGNFKVSGVGQASGKNAANLVKKNAPKNKDAASKQKRAAKAVVDNELTPLTVIDEVAPLPVVAEVFYVQGTSGPVEFVGEVCIDKPFELAETFETGSGTVSFAPTSRLSGIVSDTSNSGGCEQSGSGNYVITFDEKGAGTIKFSLAMSAVCPPYTVSKPYNFQLPLIPLVAGSKCTE
jgi:hypothetical protein